MVDRMHEHRSVGERGADGGGPFGAGVQFDLSGRGPVVGGTFGTGPAK